MDRGESERWLGISAKLLAARDLLGSRTFAIRAKESDPNNSLSDQILAVVDTVLSAEKRVGSTQQPDWYGVLQLPKLVRDGDVISDHYRRLVMLLSPDRNRLPFADYALRIVMDAWSVLSDPTKKWLFDNELALSLQNHPAPTRVDPNEVAAAAAAAGGGGSGSGSGSGSGAGVVQLNTFEFFQPIPAPPQQQQQQQSRSQPHPTAATLQMLQQQQGRSQQQPGGTLQMQQQQQIRSQTQADASLQMWQQQEEVLQMQSVEAVLTPQVVQREFIPGLAAQAPVPAQWQLRDLNPNLNTNPNNVNVSPSLNPKVTGEPTQVPWVVRSGGGDLNPNVNASPGLNPKVTPEPAQVPWVARSGGGVQVQVAPTPAPVPAPVPVLTATQAGNGNVGSGVDNNNSNSNKNNNNSNNNNNYNDVGGNNVNVDGNKRNDESEGGEEGMETFWTACPYCFYIYEHKKEYQDYTLRCQNCRRAFHALPVPNPPPVGPVGGEKGKEGEENSFCCWGFFPIGFSMVAWKKQSRNGPGNWVPFSPMFASPRGSGDGSFHWFANDGNGTPVGVGRNSYASAPRVYIDDDEVLDVSDSGGDSSDRDWRNPGKRKNKGKVGEGKRRGRPKKADHFHQEIQNSAGEAATTVDRENTQNVVGVQRGRGRPKKADKFNQDIHNLAAKATVIITGENIQKVEGVKRGRGRPRKADKVNQNIRNYSVGEAVVTVAREHIENGGESSQAVVGSVSGKKADINKTVASTVMRKQTRRTMKDRLDLNVEFNNEGDEHAPAASAVNTDEDGIENIGFFEGLDEFFSTLPILNVGGDEKAKPS